MPPVRILICPAAFLVLAIGSGPAEAKQAKYEINGQTYTYSTRNRSQVEVARRRTEAARRLDEVKARDAANPLSGLFGPRTSNEQAEAESELQSALAQPEPTLPKSKRADRRVHREHAPQVRTQRRQTVARLDQPAQSRPRRSLNMARYDRTGSLQPGATSSIPGPDVPVDAQAHMMAFVEQLRGKAPPDQVSQGPRQ